MTNKRLGFVFLLGLIFLFSALVFSGINSKNSEFPIEKKNPSNSQVVYSNEALTITKNFSLVEIAENNGTEENINFLDINLGRSTWNVSKLHLDISNIFFQRGIKVIEDIPISSKQIKFTDKAYAVQINLTASTKIYGVKIYALRTKVPDAQCYLQIYGYNPGTQRPNNILYANASLNVTSANPLWWDHTFSTPVILSPGYYSLVFNCTEMTGPPPDPGTFFWYYNDIFPKYPDLLNWRWNGIGWEAGIVNETFLYKLESQTLGTVKPSNLDLKAEINETDYSIQDGIIFGTGNLTLTFTDYFPNSSSLNIQFIHNTSDVLLLNLSYYIKLNNSLSCYGTVYIKENQDNIWTFEPPFNRFGYNYSLFYDYPDNWFHVSVFDGVINVTSEPSILNDGNTLFIGNNSTIGGRQLIITANSNELPIALTVSKTDYNAGDDLGFVVKAPAKLGKYTFILIDSRSIKIHQETKERTTTSEFDFNLTLSSAAISGTWKCFVFWTNSTDAGVQLQSFQITGVSILIIGDDNGDDTEKAGGIDPLLIFAIVLIGGIISAGSIISYKSVKMLKRTRDERRENLTNKIRDIINLNYIMVIEKKSGLNIYEQYIAGKEIDATLISGFLEAIRAFGIELTKSFDQSQTISLEYKESKVLMSEFKNFRIILILKERPSEELLRSVTALSYSIESRFGEEIKRFKGIKSQFAGIRELIEEHLHTSFVSPLKVVEKIDVKLTIGERAMIDKAKQIMKDFNLNYIHSTFLISEQKFKPRDVEIILDLIKKKIFQPTTTTSF